MHQNPRISMRERQRVSSYTNELERIRGELSNKLLSGITSKHLEKRKTQLHELGATIVDNIV